MKFDNIYEYCLLKNGTEETFPFNETTLVFKVGGKMYALVDIHSDPVSINLKCDPEYALELRETYPQVTPGYHMNKKHWNTIKVTGNIPSALVKELIDHSYQLVFDSLPKKMQKEINAES